MLVGMLFTWPSSTIRIFKSSNTTLQRPMTEIEISLFGSLSCFGSMVGVVILGFMLDIVGRKYCVIAAAMCEVIGWALIACFNRVEVILTAVFISGLGGCSLLGTRLFISEICQESIRGTMITLSSIFYTIGMLISYILGGTLSYNSVVYVYLTLSALGVAALMVLQESPVYLMKIGLDEAAQRSYAFYRNVKFDSKLVLQEMATLRRAFNPESEELNPEAQALQPEKATENQVKEKITKWEFIRKSESTRKALVVNLVIITLAMGQGLVTIQVYAEPLFVQALPIASPMAASVLLPIVTIVFGFFAAYLTDVAGRRNLLIYASTAAGLCCICVGVQLHHHWGPHWLTGLLMYLFAIFYTLGADTVPYVLSVEVFLPEIRSFMSALISEWAWLCNFLILLIFNPLLSAMGLGPVFYIFAGVCFITAIYSYFFVPETKGLPIDAIQMLFVKKRRTEQRSGRRNQ
ncbi:hypothetical protein O0L34_g10185 [Tuta absoluta]|nr:hypothetical protein O0L34_g10185 [Tuta absoluta]